MAEDYGAFVNSPVASDTGYARMQRRYTTDGVVMDGPDAGGQLTVTAAATSQLTIATGYAVVGGWFYRTDTPQTVDVPPNGSSSPRRDLVVIRADTSESACYPHIIQGTPGSTSWPAPTRNPAGVWDTVLARITVQGNSSVVTSNDVDTSVREWTTPHGAIPCTSTSRPASPFEGMLICETDTGRVLIRLGGSWRSVADTEYPTPWQPLQLRSGYGTTDSGSAPSWRFIENGRVELVGTLNRNNGAPLPHNDYYARMPAVARPNAWRRGVAACESRGGLAVMRIEVASVKSTVYLPGQIFGFHSHDPRWMAFDGIVYPI